MERAQMPDACCGAEVTMVGPGPAPAQAFDLSADLWAVVSAASLPHDRAALRGVCRSAREGADIACRHLVLRDDAGTRFNRRRATKSARSRRGLLPSDPTGLEMLRLMRRLPRLQSVWAKFHSQPGFVGATDAVEFVAKERGITLSVLGYVTEVFFNDVVQCHSLSEMRDEVEGCEGLVRTIFDVRLHDPCR